MSAPAVRYLKTPDGVNIAYAVSGRGQPFVFVPFLFHHIQLDWNAPESWLHLVAREFRLIQYDPRGQGMSQRGLAEDHSLDDWLVDLETVLDTVQADRLIVFGACHSAHIALRYAVKHPDRVAALVLASCSTRMDVWPQSIFIHLASENWDRFLQSLIPSTLNSEDAERRLHDYRQMATPEDLLRSTRAINLSTIENELSHIRTPTLVLAQRNYRTIPLDETTRLASLIPGAELATFGGAGPYGDPVEGLAAVRQFLAEHPARQDVDKTVSGLSAREIDVLRLIAAGHSNRDIAADLFISTNTVKSHVTRIFAKIGSANRAEATAFAYQHHLI